MTERKAIQYRVVYWRDIPVHVRLRQGRKRHGHVLPEIFEKTVYRAAYRAKAITGDAYQESWHAKGWFAYESAAGEEVDLEAAGKAIGDRLVAAYDEARLDALALNKGWEPETGEEA